MKIWDLDKEYEKFISFVLNGREKKKKHVRSAVEAIKNEIISKKEKALVGFSRKWDRWDE